MRDRPEAESIEIVPQEWADLFWLARVLTGDDDAAIACVAKAIDGRTASRRAVIEAAWRCVRSGIKGQPELDQSAEGGIPVKGAIGCASVLQAFGQMNVMLRFVWLMNFAEGYSHNEIAQLLNVDSAVVAESAIRSVVALAAIFPKVRETFS